MSLFYKEDKIQIREVCSDNLESEMSLIRDAVDDFPFVGMVCRPLAVGDFPGIVLGNFNNLAEYNYETLKTNVNNVETLQLGLTLSNENGDLPTCGTGKYCIWQFNIRDAVAENNQTGIDPEEFVKLMMSPGTVLNENVHLVTFHGGYDVGYLLKLLTCQNLPETQSGFFQMISLYFPRVYDVKHLMKFSNGVYGDLNYLAELLDVERVWIDHQVGSDCLLTSCTFRKLQEVFFTGSLDKYSGIFFGLGVVTNG
ncbi:PREDICTED: probable CCR4-associated factor 1 homolog 7 [Camelina sativa]|uniref:poly(A)-specific ribonuclease n=1 Tax=Camelina sativa TaxID=90675 RepID=A0ABM0Z3Z6_CAMSA|nr:PREDICTED: probable CCR4-associated factor 1 homolog 7 [Camelina sativa]